MANSTVSTLLTQAWNILNVDGSSTVIPGLQQAAMLQQLDYANKEVLRSFKRAGGEPLPPVGGETGATLIANTTLSANQTIGGTTAACADTSAFYSSGAVAVIRTLMPDFQLYTGNSGNTLTGVTGIDVANQIGDRVVQLYPLPGDFHSFRGMDGNPDGVRVNGLPYVYTSGIPLVFQFSVYDTGAAKYLFLPMGVNGSLLVNYNKAVSTLTAPTDTVSLGTDYDLFYVYRLVAHGRRVRGDSIQRTIVNGVPRDGDDLMADMTLKECMQERNTSKIVKTRPIQRRGLSPYAFFISQVRQ